MKALLFLCTLFVVAFAQDDNTPLGYFLRDLEPFTTTLPLNSQTPSWLSGVQWYRNVPGKFPRGMAYHFDGLATIMKFDFNPNNISIVAKGFESGAYEHYTKCLFFGTGTGPTPGDRKCLENPVVNLLPLNGQLWLTVDTFLWGRIDPVTLETIPGKVHVDSVILNAHPACDRNTNECFVEHPIPYTPLTDKVAISVLKPQDNVSEAMQVEKLSTADLGTDTLIQHSHSLCVTPNYVVVKLDQFENRHDDTKHHHGLLKFVRQKEENRFLIMDRNTKESQVKTSNINFVNNHFWNCYEEDNGVVVDTVTATSEYLDQYFEFNLAAPTNWSNIMGGVFRCIVPTNEQDGDVDCKNLMQQPMYVDYPTFNPLYKMNPDYQWWYGISALNDGSRWMDSIVKMNAKTGTVAQRFSEPNIYPTEANFVPRPGQTAEDDGVLLSLLYNETSDSSFLGIFDATDLSLIDKYDLPYVVPFHAHGIHCSPQNGCFSNP